MFGWDDAIGAGMGVVGGLAKLFGGDPRQKYYDAAMKQLQGVDPNTIQARDVGGIQGTAFNSIDPTSRNAMMGALQGLQNKYAQGGLDAIDRGRVAETEQRQIQTARQNQQAVLENARRTGTLNSGRALVGQLVGAQGANKTAADTAVQNASLAEQARMGALSGIVGTANTIQQGDFTKANANDALARFNKGLEVGNADRGLDASKSRVGMGLQKGVDLGNIGGQAMPQSQGSQVAGFLGTAARAGQTASKLDWGSFGGDASGGGNESDGLSMARPAQSQQDAAWNWGGDQRNY